MHAFPPRILIFDSGAGAFSVFDEIRRIMPDIHCVLALDNAFFPYGMLSESELMARVVKAIAALINRTNPDLAVIACNTASTLVLDELRRQFDIPFVGVVPAIKPAANRSKTNVIGLLATPATVERSYTENLIERFAPHAEIIRVGSSELVSMAENKLRGQAVDIRALKEILAPFISHSTLDTLVLACTHFPLLNDELKSVLPEKIEILDSGTAIAQRVHSLIETSQATNFCAAQRESHRLITTSPDTTETYLQSELKDLGFSEIEVIQL